MRKHSRLMNLNNFYYQAKFHAPLKTKFLRANQANFATKELTKAIMLKSTLRNKYPNEKPDDARLLYKKQRNILFLIEKG